MKRFRPPLPVRWLFHRRIWGFSEKENAVYLTFDDGPTKEMTPWILETLKEYNVKATFFCVGNNVSELPEQYRSILSEGHQTGNHTMSHENGNETARQPYLNSIEKASELIESDLFRPPYGRVPMSFTRSIRKKYRIIMWTWLSYDYDDSVPVDEILESARKEIRAGDIIVLHDNLKVNERLRVILPELLQIIQDKGLQFRLFSA